MKVISNRWKTLAAELIFALGLSYGIPARADHLPPPEAVKGVVNTAGSESSPQLFDRFLYYATDRGNQLWQSEWDNGIGEYINAQPIPGVNTDDNPLIGYIEIGFDTHDGLEAIVARFKAGSQCSTSQLVRFVWSVGIYEERGPIISLDEATSIEKSPDFFNSGLGLIHVKECNAGTLGNPVMGGYESFRSDTLQLDFDLGTRRMDELDVLNCDPNCYPTCDPAACMTSRGVDCTNPALPLDQVCGAITAAAISDDGLELAIACLNCLGLPGGYGDSDIISHIRRNNTTERFDVSLARYENNINTTLEESGMDIGPNGELIFSSNGVWPDSQGNRDIYAATPECSTVSPLEVSPIGSPYPMHVSRILPGTLEFSCEGLRDNCGIVYDLYEINGELLHEGLPNVTYLACHLPAAVDPNDSNRKVIQLQQGNDRLSFYLITASNKEGEGSSGYDSAGNPRLDPLGGLCGKTP